MWTSLNKIKLTVTGVTSGMTVRLISLCRLWSSAVMETEEQSGCWQWAFNPFHCTGRLCLTPRIMATYKALHPSRKPSLSELLTSLLFKNKMLPESLKTVQLQRWTEPLQLRSLWWFSSSAGVVTPRTILKLNPAQNTRKVSMARATSLWICSDPFEVLRNGVSEAEDTWPLSWTMRRSSSFRSTWSLTGTGGSEWHLLLPTSRLTLLPLRVRGGTEWLLMTVCISVLT